MKLKNFIIDDGAVHPCFVVCPGGGYDHLSNHEGDNVAEELNRYGISAFVLEYDFVFPSPLRDIKTAVRHLRGNAEKYGIYPDRIGVMGFSAGGHLAGMCAEHFDSFEDETNPTGDTVSARPDICVLAYPVVTLSKSYGHIGSRKMLGDRLELGRMLSLEESVRSDMPPVFIWHTAEDKSVPFKNSLALAEALKAKDVPFELHIFPNGRHGSDLAKNIPGTCLWTKLLMDFLMRQNFLRKESYN